MRVAIVHDYLTQRGGAERVVLAMLKAFPDAQLYTSVYNAEATFPEFKSYDIRTTWLNRVAPLRKDPRRALPVLGPTFSRMRIQDADVVIASSSGWAHGVDAGTIPKVVYCYNPPRWLHQPGDYLTKQPGFVRAGFRALRRPLTSWDQVAADTATTYVAISSVVQQRIERAYGIDAEIITPPYGVDPRGRREPVPGIEPGFLLNVSRARAYKNADLVCEAVERMPHQRLVVVGGLPQRERGVWSDRLLGVKGVSDAQLRWLYANCSALVAMSYEDFGLTPLEANAFGRPSICLRAGGYLDTVNEGTSGAYVDRMDALELEAVIDDVTRRSWDSTAIRAHADSYSPARFVDAMRGLTVRVAGSDKVVQLPYRHDSPALAG